MIIEIDVEGGTVTQVKAPKGVTVKINDYDVLDQSPDTVKQDINGADFAETVVEGTGEWADAA